MKRQHCQVGNKSGFTLIELLVVIAIIVILMAILFPVFAKVREKAKQTRCLSNLHQIAMALKQYREDFGRYPLQPVWNATANRYFGGVSALYPTYITSQDVMLCPDDQGILGNEQAAKDRFYSSYNGVVSTPKSSWDFDTVTGTTPDGNGSVSGQKRVYNYYGYSQEGWDCFSSSNYPYATTLPLWLSNNGLSWKDYPRLYNRTAPDNTIVTHCVNHRSQTNMDLYANMGGTAKSLSVSQMTQNGSDAAHPSKYVQQQ